MAVPMRVSDCFQRVFPTEFTEEDKQKLMRVTVPVPRGERRRLGVIRTTGLLFKKPEGFFDRYTSLVTRVFKMPMSLVSMVDLDRIWLASRIGLDNAEEFPRDIGFCSYTILEDTEDVLVVRDLTQDPRFSSNPIVAGPPHLRFYAGAVLVIEGQKIGSLCLVDYQPHPEFTQEQARTLREIANVIEGLFEQRRYRTMDAQNDTVRMTLGVLHSLRGPMSVLQEEEERLGKALQECNAEGTRESPPTTPSMFTDASASAVITLNQQHLMHQIRIFQHHVDQTASLLESSLSLALASLDINPLATRIHNNVIHTATYLNEKARHPNEKNLIDPEDKITRITQGLGLGGGLVGMGRKNSVVSDHLYTILNKLETIVLNVCKSLKKRIIWNGRHANDGDMKMSLNTSILEVLFVSILAQHFSVWAECQVGVEWEVKGVVATEGDKVSADDSRFGQAGELVLFITIVAPVASSSQNIAIIEKCSDELLETVVRTGEGRYIHHPSIVIQSPISPANATAKATAYTHSYEVALPALIFPSSSSPCSTAPLSRSVSVAALGATTDDGAGEIDRPFSLGFSASSRDLLKSVATKYWKSVFRVADKKIVPV